MADNSDDNSLPEETPFASTLKGYIKWVCDNTAEPALEGKDLLIYLLQTKEVRSFLINNNIDLKEVSEWYNDYLCMTRKAKMQMYTAHDVNMDATDVDAILPFKGFFGKIATEKGDDASPLDFLEESIRAMEDAKRSYDRAPSLPPFFGLDNKEDLHDIMSLGFNRKRLFPQTGNDKNLSDKYLDPSYIEIGDSLINGVEMELAASDENYRSEWLDVGDYSAEEDDDENEAETQPQKFQQGEKLNAKPAGGETQEKTVSVNRELWDKLGLSAVEPKRALCREEELDEMIGILSKSENANLIISGDSGVGKTAMIEGLAKKIEEGSVPNFLQNKKLLILDTVLLFTGTKYFGQSEEKVRDLIKEIKNQNAIVVMDNIEILQKEGNEQLMRLKGMLLNVKDINIIGTATSRNYAKNIAKDPLFNRRFQELKIAEMPKSATEKVLMYNAPFYEHRYGKKISDEIVLSAVALSSRFLHKSQPAAAKDLLDTACARSKKEQIDMNDIYDTLSKLAKVPVADLMMSEKARLLRFSETLGKNIVGQESALKDVQRILLRSAVLPDENKPKGVFLFCGPSGVGKTQMAKDLAKFFNTELITFNMAECQNAMDVTRLLGSAPGYVGYEEGGQLIDKVNQNPYAVVLFDEIEKADSAIYKVLLSVMDEGKITDTQGNVAKFNNTYVIMTSNIGAEKQRMAKVGYYQKEVDEVAENKENLIDTLKKKMAPEFVGRIGKSSIVYFSQLNKDSCKKIVTNRFAEMADKFKEKQKVYVSCNDNLTEWVVNNAIEPALGARNLDAFIRDRIEGHIAGDIIEDKVVSGNWIKVSAPSATNGQIEIEKLNTLPTKSKENMAMRFALLQKGKTK